MLLLQIMHPKAKPSTLRKGAWGSDEDTLLRKCIEKYGEGKWHLVPQRAGLNRCRKSCRLRWLNYLRPAINRGDFGEDEVDLIIRLHRLLGNRWSLIAGRLPGRTANDVKNFWNTNLGKKPKAVTNQNNMVKRKQHWQTKQYTNNATAGTSTVVIKPLPRTLSKGTRLPYYNLNSNDLMNSPLPGEIIPKNINNNDSQFNNQLSPAKPPSNQDGIDWWKNLMAGTEIHGPEELDLSEKLFMASSSGLQNLDVERDLVRKRSDQLLLPTTKALEDDQGGWSDIWDLIMNSDCI